MKSRPRHAAVAAKLLSGLGFAAEPIPMWTEYAVLAVLQVSPLSQPPEPLRVLDAAGSDANTIVVQISEYLASAVRRLTGEGHGR